MMPSAARIHGLGRFTLTAGFACLCATRSFSAPPDDQAVVETALLSLFTHAKWNDAWDSGDYLYLSSAWSQINPIASSWPLRKAITFDKEITHMIEWLQREAVFDGLKNDQQRDFLVALRDIRTQASRQAPSYDCGSLQPLEELIPKMDSRIVTGQPNWTRRHGWRCGEQEFRDRNGKVGTLMSFVRVTPPSYSLDGSFATVTMTMPWGVHAAFLTFCLQREAQAWKLMAVCKVVIT